MSRILFAWDFHGTLEKDNVRAVHALVNQTLQHFGYVKQLTMHEAVHLYGLSITDYFHYTCPEGHAETWSKMKQHFVQLQARQRIAEQYIKAADHAAEVLSAIQSANHVNILVSNTVPEWVRRFAEMVHLEKYFAEFIGLDAVEHTAQGKGIAAMKAQILQRHLAQKKYARVVKVGDRESDIQAGQAIGAVTYFIRNTYNAEQKLLVRPDYEITDLRQILNEIAAI